MRHDHDGAGTLYHLAARRAMNSHHVLTLRGWPKVLKKVGARNVHEHRQARAHKGRDERPVVKGTLRKPGRHQASKHNAHEHRQHNRARGMRLEALDRRLELVVLKYACDDLGSLVFLFAVRRRNLDELVKIVHVIARFGHDSLPLLLAYGRACRLNFPVYEKWPR